MHDDVRSVTGDHNIFLGKLRALARTQIQHVINGKQRVSLSVDTLKKINRRYVRTFRNVCRSNGRALHLLRPHTCMYARGCFYGNGFEAVKR